MVLRRCPHAYSEVMRYISGIHACLSYAAAGPERFAAAARTSAGDDLDLLLQPH